MMKRTLESRIFEVYDGLTPSERRLADTFLEHQMNFATFTGSELAQKAGVSKSTAARLIRVLGYESFPAARRDVAQEQFWGSPQARTDPQRPANLAQALQADIENLRLTFDALPVETLDRVAGQLAGARRLWILGMRSGFGMAGHAGHYFGLVRSGVSVITPQGGSYSHDIASIEPGDVLFVIGFRRRPKLLPGLLEYVRGRGARTVLLTDLSAAASARAADEVLRCRCNSPAPFTSFVAAVTVINYLAWKCAELMGPRTLERFRDIDEVVGQLDQVSTPTGRRG